MVWLEIGNVIGNWLMVSQTAVGLVIGDWLS
jgi:hypothetical protein